MLAKSIKAILYSLMVVLMAFGATEAFAQSRGSKREQATQGFQIESISTDTGVIYSQSPCSSGGLLPSAWWKPEGSPNDRYVWDDFTLQAAQNITQIDWVGGYDPGFFGSGGLVLDFTVAIYPSTDTGTQPDMLNPLVKYQVGGNAGEARSAMIGGVTMYNYTFVLPEPFTATGGVKYWVQIEAWQQGDPDWVLAKGTGGDGVYFYKIYGDRENDILLQGDAAFTLLGPTIFTPTPSKATNDGQTYSEVE